jgi:hypothetical protein
MSGAADSGHIVPIRLKHRIAGRSMEIETVLLGIEIADALDWEHRHDST